MCARSRRYLCDRQQSLRRRRLTLPAQLLIAVSHGKQLCLKFELIQSVLLSTRATRTKYDSIGGHFEYRNNPGTEQDHSREDTDEVESLLCLQYCGYSDERERCYCREAVQRIH
jgi:hypothetical protein